MVRFGRVAPTIPVQDMNRALQFYRDLLGFEVRFTNGNPIGFAIVKQGDAELHLGVDPEKAGSFHAHLMVDDLDAVHERLKLAGATIRQAPQDQPWGLRDMIIIHTRRATLVCPRDRAEGVKTLVEAAKAKYGEKYL